MALALLELIETPAGDVLELLIVISVDQAGARQHPAVGEAVSRVRLFVQIDNTLPGVPASIRAQLERAALSILEQLAQRGSDQAHDGVADLTALWHGGQLQELSRRSLTDNVAEWLQHSSSTDAHVLFDVTTQSPAIGAVKEFTHGLPYARLHHNVANHLRHCYRPRESGT